MREPGYVNHCIYTHISIYVYIYTHIYFFYTKILLEVRRLRMRFFSSASSAGFVACWRSKTPVITVYSLEIAAAAWLRSHWACQIAAPACFRGHWAFEIAAPACFRGHWALETVAPACFRGHWALETAAPAWLRSHWALEITAPAWLRSHWVFEIAALFARHRRHRCSSVAPRPLGVRSRCSLCSQSSISLLQRGYELLPCRRLRLCP